VTPCYVQVKGNCPPAISFFENIHSPVVKSLIIFEAKIYSTVLTKYCEMLLPYINNTQNNTSLLLTEPHNCARLLELYIKLKAINYQWCCRRIFMMIFRGKNRLLSSKK
jgi:hypothetical protein